MKNLKKLLAVIITVALMATMMVPVFAADEISADAEICANLNLLLGEDDGVTSEYLAKNTERIQTAIVFLRLLGKEAEAVSFDGEENFADADKVAWKAGRNVLAYLKANDDLGWVGNPDGTFDPNSKVTPQMIYKVILEVLGYKAGDGEDFDFSWKETLDFAADKGLDKVADLKNLTNDDLAAAIVEALKAETVDGEVLVEKLVEDGIIDKDDAIAEGLIDDELSFEAKIAGASKIEVAFNNAVDTSKASFEVKNGSFIVTVNVAWDDAKKVATLTKSYGKFLDGDYTVKVKGLEFAEAGKDVASFKVEAERIESIDITSANLIKGTAAGTATAEYKVYNQYGEDITATTSVLGVSSLGTVAASAGTATVSKGSPWASETVGSLTLYNGLITATKTLTLVDAKAIDKVVLGEAVLPKDTVRFSGNMTGVKVDYKAYDQYGNEMTFATTADLSVLTFIYGANVSNAVIGNDPADPTKKALLVNLAEVSAPTTATLTVLVNNTGKSSTAKIALYPVADVVDFTLTPDSAVVKAGAKYKVWIEAVDTYGSAIAGETLATYSGKFAIVSTIGSVATVDETIKYDSTAKKAYIELDPKTDAAGKSTNLVVTLRANGKGQTLAISVNEASKIVSMSLSSNAMYFADGGSATLKASFVDQYGSAVTADLAGYEIDYVTSDANVIDSITGKTVSAAVAGIAVAPKANQIGKSANLVVSLKKSGTTIDSQLVTINVIPANTTLTYVVDDIAKLHGISAAPGAKTESYIAALSVSAKDSAGRTVYIPLTAVKEVKSTNAALVSAKIFDGQYYVYGLAAGAPAAGEASATLTVVLENYDGTVSVATKVVTVTNEALVAASLKALSGTTEIDSATASFKFEAKDQFGVVMASEIAYVITNNTGNFTVSTTGDTISWTGGTVGADKYFNVTAITKNGLLKTIKVTPAATTPGV